MHFSHHFPKRTKYTFSLPPPPPQIRVYIKKGGGNDDLLAKNHYHLLHLGKSSWVFEFSTQCTFLMLVKLMKRMDVPTVSFLHPLPSWQWAIVKFIYELWVWCSPVEQYVICGCTECLSFSATAKRFSKKRNYVCNSLIFAVFDLIKWKYS